MLIHLKANLEDLNSEKIHPASLKLILDLLSDHIILHGKPLDRSSSLWASLDSRQKEYLESVLSRIYEYRLRKAPIQMDAATFSQGIELSLQTIAKSFCSNDFSSVDLNQIFLGEHPIQELHGIERLHPDSIHSSSSLALRDHIEPNGSITIPIKAFRELVWDLLFQCYAEEARTVTVCDRYALEPHNLLGLKFIIGKVKNSNVRKICIHAHAQGVTQKEQLTGHGASDAVISELSACLEKSGIRGEVYLVEGSKFQRMKHSRHLRFDDLCWDLDSGIDIFSRERLSKNHLIHRTSAYVERLKIERILEDKPEDLRRLPLY